MPVRLWWGGREVRSSWGMDVFLRAEARGRGLGARLFTAWSDHVEVALGLGLTPSSYGLFKKLRYHDVGPVPFFQKVLDPRSGGEPARRSARWARPRDRSWAWPGALSTRSAAARDVGIEVRTVTGFDAGVRHTVGARAGLVRHVRAAGRRLPRVEVRALPAPAVRAARGAARGRARWVRREP